MRLPFWFTHATILAAFGLPIPIIMTGFYGIRSETVIVWLFWLACYLWALRTVRRMERGQY